jgi:PAS domain S-box-containing protein
MSIERTDKILSRYLKDNPYVQVLNLQKAAIHIADRDLKIIFMNKFFEEWMHDLGIVLPDKIEQVSIFQLFPFLKKEVKEEYGRVFKTGRPVFSEDVHRIKGKTIISETQKIPVSRDGRVTEVLTIIQDVSKKRQAEEARKTSEEKFKGLFEFAPDAYFIADTKGNTIDGNKAVENLTGYSRDELLGRNYRNLKLLPADQIPKAAAFLAQSLLKGDSGPRELTLRRKDGNLVVAEIRTMTIKFGGEKRVLGLARDISKKKQLQMREAQMIRDLRFLNQAAMKFVHTSTNEDIFAVTADLLKELAGECVVFVNAYDPGENTLEVKAVSGADKSMDRIRKILKDNPIGMTFPLDAAAENTIRKGKLTRIKGGLYELSFEKLSRKTCRELEKMLKIEKIHAAGIIHGSRILGVAALLCRDKEKKQNIELINTFIKQASGEIQRWMAEQEIAASLREKEVMLREIHHRVKNNMQVISSLLRLQAQTVENKTAQDKFIESQNRIRSMSLIHDSLYRSKDLSLIDYGSYIQNLTSHLMSIQNAQSSRVSLKVEAENIRLDINRAIPLGLIINELVTNALKHAFPDREKGNITVGLSKSDDKHLLLTVSDDGSGMPPEVDFQSAESLGLQLVKDLSDQLRGTLHVQSEHSSGTLVKLTFPVA